MASIFKVEFSIPDAPEEAQARAAEAFADPALAVGLRLAMREAGELRYGPRVQWPFLIVLWRKLAGEKMVVTFRPRDTGDTCVTISGAVARGKYPLAADPEHWIDALGGASAA